VPHESTKLVSDVVQPSATATVNLREGPDLEESVIPRDLLMSDTHTDDDLSDLTADTVYGALPPPSTMTRHAETTLARLSAANQRVSESTFGFAVRSDNTVFMTPRAGASRTRSDITQIMNSIDGIVDLTEGSTTEPETPPVKTSERVYKMATRHDH
jgi:hypothetical protein